MTLRILYFVGAVLLSANSVCAGPLPAEAPPADFAGREFVDSKGCVFQRAGVSGTVVWVPRMDAKNQPVCGAMPSLGAPQAVADATPAPAAKPEKAKPLATKAANAKSKAPAAVLFAGAEVVAAGDSRCLKARGRVQRLWVSDGHRITFCGHGAPSGANAINALGVPELVVKDAPADGASLAKAKGLGKNGYRLAWANGALRPDGSASLAPAVVGARWIQVGAFGQAANAKRAAADLAKLGFAVAAEPALSGHLTAIKAGPFKDADALAAALDLVRRSGFPDAYPRS